jgi:hypothetical protein
VDRETSGSPTPPPQRATIRQAIEGMPVEELKKLLIKIWRELEDSRAVIDNAVRRPIPGSRKRKRKAFEFCRKCHTHFDVELNEMGSCRYHDGEYNTLFQQPSHFGPSLTLLENMTGDLEVDDDSGTWTDHDPNCHGDPLDLRLMKDPVYEDGYMMSCCDRRPYELGCIISRHKPEV